MRLPAMARGNIQPNRSLFGELERRDQKQRLQPPDNNAASWRVVLNDVSEPDGRAMIRYKQLNALMEVQSRYVTAFADDVPAFCSATASFPYNSPFAEANTAVYHGDDGRQLSLQQMYVQDIVRLYRSTEAINMLSVAELESILLRAEEACEGGNAGELERAYAECKYLIDVLRLQQDASELKPPAATAVAHTLSYALYARGNLLLRLLALARAANDETDKQVQRTWRYGSAMREAACTALGPIGVDEGMYHSTLYDLGHCDLKAACSSIEKFSLTSSCRFHKKNRHTGNFYF